MGCVEVAFKLDPAFQNVRWAIQTVLDLTCASAARRKHPFKVTMNVRFIHNSRCWLSSAFGKGHTSEWEQFSCEVARQRLQLPHARPHCAKEYQHIPGVLEHIRREMGENIARFNEIKTHLQVDPDQLPIVGAQKRGLT